MHNPVPVLDNDTHKVLWDFDIQTGHLMSAENSRPYNNQQKKNCKIIYFAVPADYYKTERLWKEE